MNAITDSSGAHVHQSLYLHAGNDRAHRKVGIKRLIPYVSKTLRPRQFGLMLVVAINPCPFM
jgi:hypothetical protein